MNTPDLFVKLADENTRPLVPLVMAAVSGFVIVVVLIVASLTG